MVHLKVKHTKQAQAETKKLEGILEAWNLKITQIVVDQKHEIMKLVINASIPNTMNLVISIAQSRFQEDLLESSTHYKFE